MRFSLKISNWRYRLKIQPQLIQADSFIPCRRFATTRDVVFMPPELLWQRSSYRSNSLQENHVFVSLAYDDWKKNHFQAILDQSWAEQSRWDSSVAFHTRSAFPDLLVQLQARSARTACVPPHSIGFDIIMYHCPYRQSRQPVALHTRQKPPNEKSFSLMARLRHQRPQRRKYEAAEEMIQCWTKLIYA